jgi:hypothetical protein
MGLVLVSMIGPATASIVSRLTSFAQVTGWPTRFSTSSGALP